MVARAGTVIAPSGNGIAWVMMETYLLARKPVEGREKGDQGIFAFV